MTRAEPGRPSAVAILPWGNVIDEFLDSIGVSQETFCREFTGSWMFRYVAALRTAGVRTVLIFVSARVSEPIRRTHEPTGAIMYFLPASRTHRLLRSGMRMPFGPEGTSVRQSFGRLGGLRPVLFPLLLGAHELVLYLSTPLRQLSRVLREEGCGVVLCQEYEYPRFDVCVALGRRLGLPVFATFQGGDYRRNRLESITRPPALRACTGLIIGSDTEIERVRRTYGLPREKIARIFNPVDVREWHPEDRLAARAALGLPAAAGVVAWHGRVSIWPKGLDVLIDAWGRVCAARPGRDLRLLLVGSGPDAEKLERRLGGPNATGVQWVREFLHHPGALRRHLAAADVYAFPSRHEGFPVAPVEAMAVGLPIVAADAQGMSDILEGGAASGGVVVPREDAGAFAAALGGLLDDEALRRELGRRARARAESAFSLETVGRQLRAVLTGSAAGRGDLPEG